MARVGTSLFHKRSSWISMLGMLSWGYLIHISEPEQAGTETGYGGIPSSLLGSSLPTHGRKLQQTCWPLKQTHLWHPAPALSAVLPWWLWVPIQSFSSLPKLPYPTKPTYQPPPLTWHKASTDTLWWSFYSQTCLQLHVDARVQTSAHGILVFVLVVNLPWQFCSAGSDHSLHLIFIQAELEVLSGQSDCTPLERRTVSVTAACKGGQESERWILNMRHRILEITLTFLRAIYVFTCFLAGWW